MYNTIIIVLLAIVICFTIGFSTVLIIHIHSLKTQLKIVTNLLCETKDNTCRTVARVYGLKDEMNERFEELTTQVNSLSSSNRLVLQEIHRKRTEKIYPTPDLVEQITATIEDQMAIELLLSEDLAVPSAGYLERIVNAVARTYPNVDIEYIAKKCTSIIHATNKRRT